MTPSDVSIVVIDDEDVMRTACRDILRRVGYHVEIFAHPEDGIARVRSDPPDVVILDLMMPRMDGHEVLAILREEAPTVRTVVITGYATRETMYETQAAGAAGFLAKPFTPSELREIVNKVALG